ncbi:hypothetical protein [Pseudaestuariivita rosea]|nr:hypothetical protein [Pseudaestuariivita rosea]
MKGQKLKLSVVVPMKGDETPEVPQPPDWMTGDCLQAKTHHPLAAV